MSPHSDLFTPITGDDGLPDFEVGLPTLSAWADVSDETILKHVKDGVIRRHGRGVYWLREALQARARFLADDKRHATKSAAESRVQDARAKEIELRIATKERELVPLEDMMDLIDRYALATKTAIRNIPVRASRDPIERVRLQPYIDEALTTIADAMSKAADEARTGLAAATPAPAPNRAARRRAARGGSR